MKNFLQRYELFQKLMIFINKKVVMKALFKSTRPLEWRYIEGYDERYIISTEGMIIDLQPQIGPLDEEDRSPREVAFNEATESVNLGARARTIFKLLRETFPDYYVPTEEEINGIKERISKQDSITYNVDFFNRLIFPNTLLTIYDTTCNKVQFFKNAKQKPSRVRIKDNKFTLYKDRTYFAVGTKNIIHFKNLIPNNAKSWGERPSKSWYQENEGKNRYITELF